MKMNREDISGPLEKCECGQPLPMHLLFALSNHTCSCGRKFKVHDRGTEQACFVVDGEGPNPGAAYDFGKMTGIELYEYSKKLGMERVKNPIRKTLSFPTEAEYEQLLDAAHLAWNDDHDQNVVFRHGCTADTDKRKVTKGIRIWVKQLDDARTIYRMEMSGIDKHVILSQMISALDHMAAKRHGMPYEALVRLREFIASEQRGQPRAEA